MDDRPYWNPSPQQEAAWERHKDACYRRWRADMLARAVTWCRQVRGAKRSERLQYIKDRFSLKFMRDVMEKL